MTNDYDVAIVGGGPAGCTLARELAAMRPELRIVLIDEKPKTGSKVCGGLLAPDAQKVLAQFDLSLPKSILADPQIFDVATMDLVSHIRKNYQRHYLNIDRGEFDRWLLSLIPCHVEIVNGRCIRIEDRFRLRIKTAAGTRQITAHYLVGADGGNSIVRRTFFQPPEKQFVAIQELYRDIRAEIPTYSCIFDPKTSQSYSWTIRKNGYLIFGGAFDKDGCSDAFQRQKARLEESLGISLGAPVKREACLLTSIRSHRDFLHGKNGIFLLGEAAGFISPSSFEGFSSAFLSGKYLADAFAFGQDYGAILRQYRKKTRKLRIKLWLKIPKMRILCAPSLRKIIMTSGICSIRKYENPST